MSTIVDRALARRDFSAFVQRMWEVVEPNTPLEWGWPYQTICDHLQAVTENRIQNLLINVPPGFLKSTIVSVLWPAWEWIEKPGLTYLTGSYDGDLSIRDAVKARRVMRSPEYRELLRDPWLFAGDQDAKTRYENNRGGHRTAISVGGKITGFRGHRIIVDDAHNASEVPRPDALRAAREWWDQGLSTRASDYRTVRRVVIGQRLAPEDLPGHIIAEGGFDHLCLPLEYEPNHPHLSHTALGFVDPRTEPGELLMPSRYPPHVLATLRRQLGSYGYAGQMQQRPAPHGGTIFQRAWFRAWDVLPDSFDSELVSVDCAFKGTSRKELEAVRELSFVVFQRWGFVGARAYLVDEARGQWDWTTTKKQFVSFIGKHVTSTHPRPMDYYAPKYIEAKANGIALVNDLKAAIPRLEEAEPEGSKIQRAYAVQAYVEDGNVYLPPAREAPWIYTCTDQKDQSWLDEVCGFPFARRNDRVDAFTQALQHRVINAGEIDTHANDALEVGNRWQV